MRRTILPLLLAAILTGCGNHQEMTDADKITIGEAGTTILHTCPRLSSVQDITAIKDAVTDLLDARETFGDQQFTLPGSARTMTVQEIIDTDIRAMRETDCVPDQRERLEG